MTGFLMCTRKLSRLYKYWPHLRDQGSVLSGACGDEEAALLSVHVNGRRPRKMGGWATVWNRVRHKSYSSYVGVRGVKSIPFQCKQGPQADGNCAGKGGSCTPYPFWPNTPFSQQEPSWQDSSPYTTYAFVPHAGKEEPSYQAYRAAQSTDVWIVHGHDLAGAQATDCGGDVHYFEHFEEPGNPGQCSKTDPYPAQDNQCSFVHPGVQQTFGKSLGPRVGRSSPFLF